MGVSQPGAVLIQPNHRAPIATHEGQSLPEKIQYSSTVRILPMKRQGTPEPGVPSLPIAFQVDDLELAHRFRVYSPGGDNWKLRAVSEIHNDQSPAREGSFFARNSADLGLVVMAIIWGINFPLIKASLEYIPPLAFNGLRFPLAAITVLLILRFQGPLPRPDTEDWPRIVALGILGNVVYQGFFIFGVDATLAGNASILLATTPVWTLGLSTLRGHEEPGLQVWFGVLATLTGMVLVVFGGGEALGIDASSLFGDLLIIGAALTWSLYTVGARGLIQKYGSIPVTAWTLWIGSVGLIALSLPDLMDLSFGTVPGLAWAGVAYAGILAIGLAYVLWYRGVHQIGNSRTAAYSNLTPIIALILAWSWLGEAPGRLQLTGATVVLVGLSLARLGRERTPDRS
jgi:drug/metabolite transporter (DMT)-like permease